MYIIYTYSTIYSTVCILYIHNRDTIFINKNKDVLRTTIFMFYMLINEIFSRFFLKTTVFFAWYRRHLHYNDNKCCNCYNKLKKNIQIEFSYRLKILMKDKRYFGTAFLYLYFYLYFYYIIKYNFYYRIQK